MATTPPSQPSPKQKPIDRYLVIGTVVVTILLFILPRTASVVIACLVVIFFLVLHPLWNCQWIEDAMRRRVAALALLAVGLYGIGFEIVRRARLEISIMGAALLASDDSGHSRVRLSVEVKNVGDTSTFLDRTTFRISLGDGSSIDGVQLLRESRPQGGTELPSLSDQEFVPGKRITGVVDFSFPLAQTDLANKVCFGGGKFAISILDSKELKQWTSEKSFADERKDKPCWSVPNAPTPTPSIPLPNSDHPKHKSNPAKDSPKNDHPLPSPPQTADHGIINNAPNQGDQKIEDNRHYGVPTPPPHIVGLEITPLPAKIKNRNPTHRTRATCFRPRRICYVEVMRVQYGTQV